MTLKKSIKKDKISSCAAGKLFLAAWLALAAGVSAAAFSAMPQDVEDVPATDNMEVAADTYKAMKQLQYEGTAPDSVYSLAYKTFGAASAAIRESGREEADFDRLRGILQDVSGMLARGAVNASQKGDSQGMTLFSKAFVDTYLMPEMAAAQLERDPELYPSMVYVAASGSYNAGKFEDALRYFEEYLKTGAQKNRENVAMFYGQTLLKTMQPERGIDALVSAANEYPGNQNILNIAMQMCLDANRKERLDPLLERALQLRPDDEKLLNLFAQSQERKGDFKGALDTFMRLDELKGNSLQVSEGIARSYYNLATVHYNEGITAPNEKDAAKSRRQSNAYFSNAIDKYEELSATSPNELRYLKPLTTCYAILGNKSKVDALNVRLTALGESPMAMNTMPVMIGDGKAAAAGHRSISSYQEYAEGYVTAEITKWAKRGEFEKVSDYNKRMSPENIAAEQRRLSAVTEEKYLREFASRISISELQLQPYDVDHETYAVESDFGPVYVKVPLKNKEAELFKSNWEKMQIRNAKFFIQDDAIAISAITFHMPNGKDYSYNSAKALAYRPPVVNVDPSVFLNSGDGTTVASNRTAKAPKKVAKPQVESDVDKNIPQNKPTNTNTIALVIANENYTKVPAVTSAEHDGDVVARYCRETLGIPENQVLHFKDVTYGNILSAVNRLKNAVSAMGSSTDVIVYYAGHGVPDENTKDAYMLPVDADPQVMATAYPLATLYQELGGMGARNVMVFMDACFSGANRGDGMLADARAVVLKPKAAAPKGNMFVLSAADGNETALPWKEKNHGLFTYWLLKKLQDSKGNATLQEIAEYVKAEVRKTASLQLNKPQTPKMTVSGALQTELSNTKLR